LSSKVIQGNDEASCPMATDLACHHCITLLLNFNCRKCVHDFSSTDLTGPAARWRCPTSRPTVLRGRPRGSATAASSPTSPEGSSSCRTRRSSPSLCSGAYPTNHDFTYTYLQDFIADMYKTFNKYISEKIILPKLYK
jgi:hypothetical protein